jgi:serine/threonine protein kinase
MIGKIISHYRILEKIGEGGMGIVYKAEDTKLKRIVALKFLLLQLIKSEEEKHRFLREAQAAAALVHPDIATIYAFEEWEGENFISMEYVDGQTLDQVIHAGSLSVGLATEFFIAAADALSLAHRKGIVHRDLKPGNIMVTSETSTQAGRQIKVMDFGLAKFKIDEKLTLTGTIMGTVSYMSPEQARGELVDLRSDIFSLGAVFYEMLAGHPAFVGREATAILYNIVHEEPTPLSKAPNDIPQALEKIVNKCLAKDPENRFQNMAELLDDMAAYQYNPYTLAVKAGVEKKSIAVLPFDDISPGGDNEYLSDGMTEELIMTLSQNPQLRVIARTSVMQYKNQSKDVRHIGRELGISYVLEGSVRRFEENLRVTAQLVDADNGSHLWADKYDGIMKDIFKFQEEVAQKVTGALEAELGERGAAEVTKPTLHSGAYEYYLQGKLLLDVQTLPNLDRSVILLKKALELDPHYTDAYGTLASAYLWYFGTGLRPDPEYLTKAEEMANRALAIDKEQADANYVVANLAMVGGRIEEAFLGFTKVLENNPNHKDARLFRIILLYLSSYFEEALQEADQWLARDPFYPMAHWIHSTIRLHQGMFDAAVAEYEQVVTELTSKLVWLALAYRYAGKMDKAWKAASKVKQLEPDGILWAYAFAFLEGAEGKGKEILRYVDEKVKGFGWDFHIAAYWAASFYAMADDKEEAFRWMERAIELGNRNYRWFAIDPNLENLREDPRFVGTLEKAETAAKKLGKYLQ